MQIGVVYPQVELGGDPVAVGRVGKAVEDFEYDYLLGLRPRAWCSACRPNAAASRSVHRARSVPRPVRHVRLSGRHHRANRFGYRGTRPSRSARPRWWPARSPTSICYPAVDSASAWAWAGTTSSTKPSDRTSALAVHEQEEQVELLRRLFVEPIVDFAGRFDRVDRAALVPKPTRSIPIWLGGFGEKAFDRAARLADGFIFFGAGGVAGAVDAWKSLRGRITKLGRSDENFGGEYVALSEGVDNITAEIESWRAAGGTHVAIATMGFGLDSVDAHIDYIASMSSALNAS